MRWILLLKVCLNEVDVRFDDIGMFKSHFVQLKCVLFDRFWFLKFSVDFSNLTINLSTIQNLDAVD